MEKTLLEFYKDVLLSLGFPSDDEGYIMIGEEGEKMPITIEGKPLVLPTKDHINTLLEKDENDNIVSTKVLYNPLKESAIKGNSLSLVKTKTFIEGRLSFSILIAGDLLLHLVNKPELQKKAGFEVSKFLSTIHDIKNINIKEIVDEKSIQAWHNIYCNAIDAGLPYVKIYLKKASKENGVKYNRAAVLSSPVYSELLNADTNTPVMKIKLRNKDIKVFKALFEYLLPGIDVDPNTIIVGSNDLESPAFISLLTMYINIVEKLNRVMKELANIDKEKFDKGYNELHISVDELSKLNKFATEVNIIPSENEIEMNKTSVIQNTDMSNKMNNYVQNTVVARPTTAGYDQPLPLQAETYEDPVDKALALRGLNNPLANGPVATLNQNGYNTQTVIQPQPQYIPNGVVNNPPVYNPQLAPQQVMVQQPLTGANNPQPILVGLPPLPQNMGYNVQNMTPNIPSMAAYPQQMNGYYQNGAIPQPMVYQQPLTGVNRI